jgi:hypothetical protein
MILTPPTIISQVAYAKHARLGVNTLFVGEAAIYAKHAGYPNVWILWRL